MKNLSLSIFIFSITFVANAQQNVLEAPEDGKPESTSKIKETRNEDGPRQASHFGDVPPDSNEVFVVVEQMPEFEGGQESLMNFIRTNVRYPESAVEQELQGKVFVEFVVYPSGELGQCKILRGVHSLLDNEAMRVVKATAGKWKPGKQNGKPVAVQYRLPVVFRLQ